VPWETWTSTLGTEMDDAVFWQTIARLDWMKPAMTTRLSSRRSSSSPGWARCRYRVRRTACGELYQLDTRMHAMHIGTFEYKGEESFFSEDNFLYARCVVVANGQDFFRCVLVDPRAMPKHLEFESVLTIAPTAYERMTAQSYSHVPRVSMETFSNLQGWSEQGRNQTGD